MSQDAKSTTITIDGASLTATARPSLQASIDALLQRFADVRPQWSEGLFVWNTMFPIVMASTPEGFVLETPDLERDAYNDRTTDLSLALAASDGIVRVLRVTGRTPKDVHFDDTLEAVKGWATHDRLVLARSAPRDRRDSGWFVDLLGDDSDRQITLDDIDVPGT